MRFPAFMLTAALLPGAIQAYADPCGDVVEDTVAELRAGATGWWSEEAEGLVRAAAGSACVKATSGRYTAVSEVLNDQPVASSASEAASEVKEDAEEDDGSWDLGGLKVRSLSGSPAKKPYQRQREQKDEE